MSHGKGIPTFCRPNVWSLSSLATRDLREYEPDVLIPHPAKILGAIKQISADPAAFEGICEGDALQLHGCLEFHQNLNLSVAYDVCFAV